MMKMYSDPNYINGRMQKAGIVGTQDEIFPQVFNTNIKPGKKLTTALNKILKTGVN